MSFLASNSITRQNSLFFAVLADYKLSVFESRSCKCRSSILRSWKKRFDNYFYPEGKSPLRGLVRRAELSKQPINDIYFLNAVNIRCVKVHG